MVIIKNAISLDYTDEVYVMGMDYQSRRPKDCFCRC